VPGALLLRPSIARGHYATVWRRAPCRAVRRYGHQNDRDDEVH